MNDDISGGAAYPRSGYYPPHHPDGGYDLNAVKETATEPTDGMTLLDYFAGQALNGLVAMEADHPYNMNEARRVARTAYMYAAQMIEVRKMVPHVGKLCECDGGGQVGEVPPIPEPEVPPIPPHPPFDLEYPDLPPLN